MFKALKFLHFPLKRHFCSYDKESIFTRRTIKIPIPAQKPNITSANNKDEVKA